MFKSRDCHSKMTHDSKYANIESIVMDTVDEYKNSKSEEELNEYLLNVGYLVHNHSQESVVDCKQTKPQKQKIDSYVITEEKTHKADLLNEYMRVMHDNIPNSNIIHSSVDTDNHSFCHSCDTETIMDKKSGYTVCPSCGVSQILIYSDIQNDTSGVDNVQVYCYKRMSHFEDWMNSIQAKEFNKIPDEVIECVRTEIQKSRQSIDEISNSVLRLYLKKHKFNKYYENIPSIKYKLKGKTIPKISRQSEEKMRTMFMMIQGPFKKHCPPTRKNFLSYTFILHKFCELLDEDEVLEYLPNLLKSRTKLAEQDRIWKLICKELNWQYIPTV